MESLRKKWKRQRVELRGVAKGREGVRETQHLTVIIAAARTNEECKQCSLVSSFTIHHSNLPFALVSVLFLFPNSSFLLLLSRILILSCLISLPFIPIFSSRSFVSWICRFLFNLFDSTSKMFFFTRFFVFVFASLLSSRCLLLCVGLNTFCTPDWGEFLEWRELGYGRLRHWFDGLHWFDASVEHLRETGYIWWKPERIWLRYDIGGGRFLRRGVLLSWVEVDLRPWRV